MGSKEKLLFENIVNAEKIVSKHTIATPMVYSKVLSEAIGQRVSLKLENQQITGSFKIRGAINAISNLTPAQKTAGVVALSTGNHGRGLAYAANLMNIRRAVANYKRLDSRTQQQTLARLKQMLQAKLPNTDLQRKFKEL